MSITLGVPMPDYLVMSALSSGVAFECVTRSPMHARHRQLNQDRWSKTADLGTVIHQILLEGNEDGVVWVEANDWRTKDARAARDDAYANGKTPLLDSQRDDCDRLIKAVRRQLEQTELAGVFGTGNAEVTVEWEDQGVACKARPDYLTEDFHISLNPTAASAEPNVFNRRTLTPSGYDFSLMFYDRGLKANGWDGEHRILVIEQVEPYAIQVFAIDSVKKTINADKAERAIKTWAKCLANAEFPGYYGGKTFLAETTPWELAEAETRELEMMVGA